MDTLQGFAGMPMDIILEILEYLDPLDLLRLARTTKKLRATLMSRSSLALWKRVRHTYYQMPDGPDGMSEPHYACLTLDNICYGCGLVSNRDTRTFWHAQLRSCGPCESDLLVNKSKLKEIRSSKALTRQLIALLDVSNTDYRYSWKQAQCWLQQSALLVSGSPAEIEWEGQILADDARIKQNIISYFSWYHAQQIHMKEALIIKLGELGWAEEISKMASHARYQLDNKLFENRPKSFSQAWSLNGHSIVKYLNIVQAARVEEEWKMLLSSRYKVLQSIYDEYVCGLPAGTLLPNIADVALSPPVHAILTDKQADLCLSRQSFENINLVQSFPSIVSDWKTRLEDELIQIVQVTFSEPFTKDHLPLATTIFYCNVCCINLFYPRVLVHQCSSQDTERRRADPIQCPAWNSSGNIIFNQDIYQAAVDIVKLFGLDPKTATVDDMGNGVLQCLDCMQSVQGRITMVWSRAIDHSRHEHNCRPALVSWKVPGQQGQSMLQASLAAGLAESDGSPKWDSYPRFMCGHCRQKTTLLKLKEHLLKAHKVHDPGDNDILLHPDATHTPMPIVLPETD